MSKVAAQTYVRVDRLMAGLKVHYIREFLNVLEEIGYMSMGKNAFFTQI